MENWAYQGQLPRWPSCVGTQRLGQLPLSLVLSWGDWTQEHSVFGMGGDSYAGSPLGTGWLCGAEGALESIPQS